MGTERPRKSHYIPAFYLVGFTASGEVGGNLFVFDQSTGRDWVSSPRNAATERDFYMVDLGPGEDPDIMEKILARLETDFSGILQDIVAQQRFPASSEDFNWFLNFVALMVARIPRTRRIASEAVDRATKAHLRQALASRDGWDQFRQACAAGGHEIADDEYEHYKKFAESENYSVGLDQTSHVQMMAKDMIDALLPALAERSWALGVATEESPDFICSDVPVGVWPVLGADLEKPITLLTPNTVLSCPISRRMVAIARYEKQRPVRVVVSRGVSLFNTWTLSEARHVFSSTSDFSYLRRDGTVGCKADLRAGIRGR
jgi:hypothetical protein